MLLTGEPIPYDPTFDGPLKNRSCTDIICMLVFFIFIGCWIGIGLFGKYFTFFMQVIIDIVYLTLFLLFVFPYIAVFLPFQHFYLPNFQYFYLFYFRSLLLYSCAGIITRLCNFLFQFSTFLTSLTAILSVVVVLRKTTNKVLHMQ